MWPGKHLANGYLLVEELDSLPKDVLIRRRCLMGLTFGKCAWMAGLLGYWVTGLLEIL